MLKNKPEEVDCMDIFNMIEDILKYLSEDGEGDYETSQEFVSFKYLFRGIVMKDWKRTDLECRKYRILNKIFVRHCMLFCKKCWDNRNKAYYDINRQRNRTQQLCEKIKMHVLAHIMRNF